MAIGRSFEEAVQKAVRMVLPGSPGLEGSHAASLSEAEFEEQLRRPTDRRLWQVQHALEQGWPLDRVHALTRIDRWFLAKLKNIATLRAHCQALSRQGGGSGGLLALDKAALLQLKQHGFADVQIARYLTPPPGNAPASGNGAAGSEGSPTLPAGLAVSEAVVRRRRLQLGVVPCVKQIDTLAAEFPCSTNYLYMTYHGTESDVSASNEGVMVLGCGAYCIGSSVEFDWSAGKLCKRSALHDCMCPRVALPLLLGACVGVCALSSSLLPLLLLLLLLL
jgi:hypothetical protein